MGYGTTPNAIAGVDLQSADLDAIIAGICGDDSPVNQGSNSANLGDIYSVLDNLYYCVDEVENNLSDIGNEVDSIDYYAYEIREYLSGSYSGPLSSIDSYAYYIDSYLSQYASEGMVYQIRQDIATMKAQLDKLTFDGSNNLKVVTS